MRVCRSGYTGERGYEVLPRWDDAERVFRALLDAVRAQGGQAAGLGARDTLRTEMGYALHGHELSVDISRSRRGSAGPWAGRSRSSGGATPCSARRRRARRGNCGACGHSTAASCVRI